MAKKQFRFKYKQIEPILTYVLMGVGMIFLLYLIFCSKQKDIYRVFQYHGAEHKSIFCYEAGLPLTVENVRMQSRKHPRCGTSFLFVVLIIALQTNDFFWELGAFFIPLNYCILLGYLCYAYSL